MKKIIILLSVLLGSFSAQAQSRIIEGDELELYKKAVISAMEKVEFNCSRFLTSNEVVAYSVKSNSLTFLTGYEKAEVSRYKQPVITFMYSDSFLRTSFSVATNADFTKIEKTRYYQEERVEKIEGSILQPELKYNWTKLSDIICDAQ